MPDPIDPRAAARRMAISAIQGEIDDAMGIGEQLDDALDNLTIEEGEQLIADVTAELEKIRDELRVRWEIDGATPMRADEITVIRHSEVRDA